MSYFDFQVSNSIALRDYPFDSLIMAAMQKADTANLAKLCEVFPEVWVEFDERYHAPGGILPTDRMGVPE